MFDQLPLPEAADQALEDLIARQQTCAIHHGTTLDSTICGMCELEAPRIPAWVRRAAAAQLPYKVFR